MAISTKVYSDLLESLYAATVEPAQWQVFLDRLCAASGSGVGMLLRNDSALGNRVLAAAGMPLPPQVERDYQEGHAHTDPVRQAFMRSPRTGILEIEDLIPHAEFIQTDVYRFFMQPFNIDYGTIIVPFLSPRTYELIGIYRDRQNPWLPPETRELLDLLFPHIQNALRIHRALSLANERMNNAEAALDNSSDSCILLDAEGRIVFMNDAAKKLAAQRDGFAVNIDRPVPTAPGQRRAFSALVRSAAQAEGPGGAIALERSGRKRPLQFLVTPFRLEAAHRASARVILLATDPDRPVRFPDAILHQLYGLTAAETEIASGLLTGFSLDEIALLRRVSTSTVRTQMKSLLAKTSTHRQADLVRLLMTLPRPVEPTTTD